MECTEGNCHAEDNPDPTACGCPPCPNARFCGVYHIPQVYLDIHHGTCGNCAVMFGKRLEVTRQGLQCAVCMEDKDESVVHPSGCRHRFCVDCVTIMFWPERVHHRPTAEEYGWAGGDESDEEWEQFTESAEGKRWDAACDDFDERMEGMSISTCPLCRREPVPDWKTQTGAWKVT